MAGFSTEGVMPMMPYGCSGADGFMGNGQGGWMFFLLILVLFGRGGFGSWGGANGFTGGEVFADQFALQDIKNNQRAIDGGIRGLEQGICSSTYEMAQQNAMTREQMGLGFANLGSRIDSCCCETNRNIDAVKYEMAKGFCDVVTAGNLNTRDLIANQDRNTQRILDTITSNTIQDLRDKNQELTMSALLQQQTTNITNVTNPRSIPAYPVCSPYEALYGWGRCGNQGCC